MANSTTNLNSAGDSLYHLRRIGPPATADEVVSIMDFYKSTYMIGRNAARVDFYLNSSSHIQSQSLSRCHARIVRQAGNKHLIYDDSLNGVYINNIKISGSCILNEGDTVTFGHPRGAHLPAGSRSRQPNSEYQFMFEVCSCTDQKDQPSKANKPAFKKPVSQRISSPESSQTSPKVSSRPKSSVEKESHDKTSEGNVSAIETVGQSGSSENTEANSGLINQLIETPQNKSETEEILENQSVTIEKEIGGNDNQIHSEVCNKLHNVANSKIDILEVATAKCETTVNKVESINVATGVSGEITTNAVEDMDVDSDSEAKISELEITANSILSDLCAIREGVENNCTRRQSLDPEQFKSPTKDMGIQTTQRNMLSPTKEMGIQTTQRDMSYILSPTKEMGIQTSQGVFNDTVNVCDKSDGASEIRNLFTSPHDPGTEVEMKDSCVGNTLNQACKSDLFENKEESVEHEHISVDNCSVSNIAEDNQISEVDNIDNNAEYCKIPHNEHDDKLSHTKDDHVNNIQCIEEIDNNPPIETDDANLPEIDNNDHNSIDGEEDINPQNEEVDEVSIADKENYVQLSEAESSVEIDCAQANVENYPDDIDDESDKISTESIEYLDSGSSEATSSVSKDNVNEESGISDEEVECVVLPKVDTDIDRSFLVDEMKSCADSPHLSLSDSIAYDVEDDDNGRLNYVPSNSMEFDDDYGSYHEDSDRKSVDSENKSGDHVELEEASSAGTVKLNSDNIDLNDEVGFEQTVDSLEKTSRSGSEKPNNVEREEETNDDKFEEIQETMKEDSENLNCTVLNNKKDSEMLLSNNKISCDNVSQETCLLESGKEVSPPEIGTEYVSDNDTEAQHDVEETCRKRKMSTEISDVDSDDDNVRKRHCSENVDNLNSIKEFPDTDQPIISGDSDPVIPDADKQINGVDSKEMTSSDIVNRNTLDKFKDGVKQFFTTWSEKSDVSSSPERSEYVYVQDQSGKVKQLHLDVPKIVKSHVNELGQLEGRSNEDAVEDNSVVLDNIQGDVVISSASKIDKIEKLDMNAYNDSKAIQEVPENESEDALTITDGHKNKVEETNNIDEISDGKNNDLENNDRDESGNNDEVLESNINDSGRKKDNSEQMDEHSEIIEEYIESIVTENEDKISSGNEENKADDLETYVTSSQIGEDMETGNESEINLYPAVKMSPWKQKLLNDVPRSSDSDMSPVIEKYQQKESSCDKNKTTTWLSSLPLQGSKPDKLENKADQYDCEFSDEENDDEFEFPSPDIDFSYYSDKDNNDGDVNDEDDAVSKGSSNGSNDGNNLGIINNVGTNNVNDGMNDGCSETVSVKKVENLKKADIEQNDVSLVDTFNVPDAENKLVCIDKVCHSEKIIDDDYDVVSQIVSVVDAKSETGNGKTVNNPRKYINGDGDVISIDSVTDDAESDLEELLDCSKKSNDQNKAINKSFDLEFDFCDSQSESDEIKALDNGANVREKDSKRKSDPHPQETVTKKSKVDSNDVDHDESTNEEFVTPFKTPAVSRHKLNVSNHQSPGSLSCTQLMESSQSPDLNSLSLTQISTIKDQLEIKANDKSRVKESRNKAKSLIEKLRARKRVKEEVNTDFPSTSTDDEVGSTSIETSSDTCSTSAVDTQAIGDNINQHVSSCRNVIDQLKSMFSRNVKLQDNPRVQAWRRELSEVEKRIEFAKTVIAVVGDTGAGKSSLMNAVLDHRSVLPTSGMRACTAVVVEVVANTTSNEFVADIEFLQKKEWFDELEVLLNDLKGLDGTIKNRPPDPTSDAYVSYCKVKAVYGKIDEFRILSRLTMVTHWLGKVKVVRSRRAEDFRKQVEKYIETQEPTGGGQYWPIVKHVTLKIPNCDVCSTGASLVDLPGVRDSNAARDKIAREYLKRCTAVWVVSSIHRAIDDKTAKDLLGENFRRQLLMDGQYGSIAFICTKTDVIIPSEIIRSLHLEGDTKELEDEIKTMEAEKCELDLKIMRHPKDVKSLNKQIEETRQEVEELQETLSELKSLLEGAEEETSQSEEKEAIQEYEGELKQKQDEITTMENQLESSLEENQFSTQKVLELEGRLNVKRKIIAAMCAKARNEYSKSQIRRDFKAGLKEMKRRAGMLEENEEEDIYDDDDDDGDDDGDIGSSAENLKVFCCSSTEYQKMKNLLTDDGPPQVFSELNDTQIPALRLYVHEMTSVRRKQSLERLIRNLGSFVFDVQTYLSESGDTKFKNRQFVKSVIDSELQKFTSSLEPVIQQLISDIDEVFDGSIKQKLQQGASNASSEANDTCHKWGAPMNRDKSADRRSGGLHFATYRATVRRHGAFKSPTFGNVDFNEELAEPMYRSMTIVWDRAFSGLLWKLLDKIQASILGQIKLHCRQLSNQLVQLGIPRDRVNRVSAQLEGSASNKLLEMVGQLKDTVTNRQRDISRLITPHIQTSLTPVYDQCSGESGPGMYNRIKTCVSHGIDTRRTTMFDQATLQLMQALMDLQDEIIQYVRQVSGVILGDLRTAFEPLWDTPGNSHLLKAAFMNQMLSTCSEVRQLYTAAGLRNTEERSASTSTQSGASHNNVSSVCAPSTSCITVPSARTLKVKIEPSTSCSGRTTCMNTTLPISTSYIKKEKTGAEQSRTDASTSNFGIQTLQDLQAGHLDISPVEVTVNTTPTYNIIPSHRDMSVQSIVRPTNQQWTSNIPSSAIRVPVFNSTSGAHPTIQGSNHTLSSTSDYASLMTQQGRQSVLYTGQPLPSGTVIIPVSSAGKQGVKVVNVPMKSIIKTEFINKENMASVPGSSSQTRLLNSSQTKVKTEKPSKTSLSLSQRNSPANTRTIPKIFIKTEPADNAPTGRRRPKYLGTIDLTDD